MSIARARRIQAIRPFLAMEVLERALELERSGRSIVHLEVGEPDLSPPATAVEACIDALHRGVTHYTDSRGTPRLREAIARDLATRFALRAGSVDPARIVVTMGTSPAMLLVFEWLLDPGDEVVLGTPHYPCYPNFVRLCGGVPVFVPTDPEAGHALDPERVRRAITPRTKAILVNSPSNPTGAVQSRETLEALASLGPVLVSDEIYDGIVYDGVRTTSALEVSEEAFVLDGFSKRHAMTGFRLGWVVAPRAAARDLQVMQQSLFISASSFAQEAAVAALESGADDVARMRRTYAGRRDRLVAGLRALGFGVPRMPQGAFYVLADARPVFGARADSLALAFALLERAGVGVAPGIDFGEAAEGFLRFCYAVADEAIDEALARIGAALPALSAAGGGAP